jgi:hypothetical protein
MTDPLPLNDEPEPAELQFDNAEYATSPPRVVACSTCQRELSDSYFAVLRMTGSYYGLISILVGVMVGAAVRAGSRRRGGWVYQTLAVFLTYFSIGLGFAAHHTPDLIAAMEKAEQDEKIGKGQVAKDPLEGKQEPAAPNLVGGKDSAKPGDAEKLKVPPANPKAAPLTPAMIVLGLIVLCCVALLFVLACPFLVAFSSPISFFIVAFALWEAWKMNRRPALVFSGPFQIASNDAPLHADRSADE